MPLTRTRSDCAALARPCSRSPRRGRGLPLPACGERVGVSGPSTSSELRLRAWGEHNAHRFGDRSHVLLADAKQAEPELVPPIAASRGKLKCVEERCDQRIACLQPCDVAAIGGKIPLCRASIGLPVAHDSERRERLASVAAAKFQCGRVAGDTIVRLDAPQRRRLAVADLHEAGGAAAPYMLGRGDGDPILDGRVRRHGVAGAKTRRRWPSGSRATKVKPKSMAVGGWAILSLRRLQSAWVARTASAS